MNAIQVSLPREKETLEEHEITNWFVPNAACLRGWLISAGFEVIKMEEWTMVRKDFSVVLEK